MFARLLLVSLALGLAVSAAIAQQPTQAPDAVVTGEPAQGAVSETSVPEPTGEEGNAPDAAGGGLLEIDAGRLIELTTRNAMLEAKAELNDDAYSRLEILITVFGILMAVGLIVFAIQTSKAAAIAAKGEIATERDAIEAMRKEAVAILEGVKSHREQAASELARISDMANIATRTLQEGPTNTEDKTKLAQAATAIADKPIRDLTEDEFRVRIGAAAANEDFFRTRDLAITFRELFTSDTAQAFGLFAEGWAVGRTGDSKSEIATCEELLRRFGDSPKPALREQVAKALVNKGFTQVQSGDQRAAIATNDEVVRRFGDSPEPALREQVAMALVNKGLTQVQSGDLQAAIATNEEVVRRFGDSAEPALRVQVAKALVNKGITEGQSGDSQAAIATCEEVVRRFGDSPEPALRELVAKALVCNGITQGQSGDPRAAIATNEEVVRRFGDSPEPALRVQVAKALFNKGITEEQSGDSQAAIATCEEVVRRFGDSPEPALRELVAGARYNRACAYAKRAMPAEAVSALEDWKLSAGKVDCDKVLGDSDFGPIRQDARFIDFMKRNGCTG